MAEPLKIVIPMAGWGTRMRPHTWSKPKPLIDVAGRTALDHLLAMFGSVPDANGVEYVFIVGPYLGELQIPRFMEEHYPKLTAHYVVQEEMKGQSAALYLARKHLGGPVISCFSDTLIETDFSFLDEEKADGVIWVKSVPDPRRFGVAEVDAEGWVRRLVEKPQSLENDLALVGCYYFRRGDELIDAIEEQMRRNVQLKDEFFLADAVNIMLDRKALFRPRKVDVWLDTGTIESTLETNRHLLERAGSTLPRIPARQGLKIVPPVFVHPSAHIEDSWLGPHASIGAGCRISGSRIEDSILGAACTVTNAALKGSILGTHVTVEGAGLRHVLTLNAGDHSSVHLAAAPRKARKSSGDAS